MVKGSDLSVDKKKCTGDGVCVSNYEQLFKFDKQGKAEVKASGECEDCDIQEIIDCCPSNAISKSKKK